MLQAFSSGQGITDLMGITESPNLLLFLSPPLPTFYLTDWQMEREGRVAKKVNLTSQPLKK